VAVNSNDKKLLQRANTQSDIKLTKEEAAHLQHIGMTMRNREPAVDHWEFDLKLLKQKYQE
jgi:hypothetical protein